MAKVIREITFESEVQSFLERQLAHSAPDGCYQLMKKSDDKPVTMTVHTKGFLWSGRLAIGSRWVGPRPIDERGKDMLVGIEKSVIENVINFLESADSQFPIIPIQSASEAIAAIRSHYGIK